MNVFAQQDAFSSQKSVSINRNVYAYNFGGEVDHKCYMPNLSFEGSTNMVFQRQAGASRFAEEDLPKFHFPSNGMDLLVITEGLKDRHRFSDNEEDHSTYSQSSTRANFTREAVDYSDVYLNTSDFSATSFPSGNSVCSQSQEAPSRKVSREQLPTLEEIFNLKKTSVSVPVVIEKPNSKIVEKQLEITPMDANEQVDFLIAAPRLSLEKQDLSKRGDVINKTLLRAMKRYYFTEFDSIYNFSSMDNTEKFTQFKDLIKKFVTEEMEISKELNEKELEDAIFFFGSMISHVHMRRGITISKMRTQVNFVHKCLYNYSHKKLSQLMQNEGFKHVLGDFVKFDGLDVVLNSEETMLKQQDLYKVAASELLLKAQE